MGASLSIVSGRTVHRREKPFVRAFSHAVTLLCADIDDLDRGEGFGPALFSARKPALFRFRRQDYGARSAEASLRSWADSMFAGVGINSQTCRINLVFFPRVAGMGFSPIALWIATSSEGAEGVIYEVHNTFGQVHAYAARLTGEQSRHSADKSFHVSPFFDVSGRYVFSLSLSPDRLGLVIENQAADGREHVASLVARFSDATDAKLALQALRMPLSGLGVVAAIHWQAFWIWLRGARYRPPPTPPSRPLTPAELIPPRIQDTIEGLTAQ